MSSNPKKGHQHRHFSSSDDEPEVESKRSTEEHLDHTDSQKKPHDEGRKMKEDEGRSSLKSRRKEGSGSKTYRRERSSEREGRKGGSRDGGGGGEEGERGSRERSDSGHRERKKSRDSERKNDDGFTRRDDSNRRRADDRRSDGRRYERNSESNYDRDPRSRDDNGDDASRRDRFFKKGTAEWRRGEYSNRGWNRGRPSRQFHPYRRPKEPEEEPPADRPAWATRSVIRHAEEIQKRKFLWAKKDEKKDDEGASSSSATAAGDSAGAAVGQTARRSTESTWNSILAATTSDSKQMDKFQRLMGLKKPSDSAEAEQPATKLDQTQVEAERQRQNKLIADLDEQYAVARAITHLGRGQGLGFH